VLSGILILVNDPFFSKNLLFNQTSVSSLISDSTKDNYVYPICRKDNYFLAFHKIRLE
jgi:hypothetical protein